MREKDKGRQQARQAPVQRHGMRPSSGRTADGPISGRGTGGPIVRHGQGDGRAGDGGGRVAMRLLGVALVGAVGYWAVGTYRAEIVALAPYTYPYFRALGFEVEEPFAYGLRFEGSPAVMRVSNLQGQNTALLVQGTIVNGTKERRAVPKLRITVSGSRGADVIWAYELPQTTIEPGARLRFQSRYEHTNVVPNPTVRVDFEKR